jgi:hypothetical protein
VQIFPGQRPTADEQLLKQEYVVPRLKSLLQNLNVSHHELVTGTKINFSKFNGSFHVYFLSITNNVFFPKLTISKTSGVL